MAREFINVALCNDKKYEPGLHVTLRTLLVAYSDPARTLRIYFFFQEFSQEDVARIHETLSAVGKPYELVATECTTELFESFRSLHGNHLTYVRLAVPELISADRVVFLDSDVIVNANVADLFDSDLQGKCLGVVANGFVKAANDHELLESLGMSADTPYFNAAVLLIDAAAWRARRYTEQCIEFLRDNRGARITVDQTALNYVLRNDFRGLPQKYNVSIYPTDPPATVGPGEGIFHLCGSPKPWDPFGRVLHGNYGLFYDLCRQTALGGVHRPSWLVSGYVMRTAWLARSYASTIRMKWSNMRLARRSRRHG